MFELSTFTEHPIKLDLSLSVLEETEQPSDHYHRNTILNHSHEEAFSPNSIVCLGEIQEDQYRLFLLVEAILDCLNDASDLVITASAFAKASLLTIKDTERFRIVVQPFC